MKLDFAVLADDARQESDGRISIIGLLDEIISKSYPVRRDRMVLVLRFLIHPSEIGRGQRVVVRLADEDGGELFEWRTEITPKFKKERVALADEVHINQLLALKDLTFPKAGRYAFDILINEGYVTTVRLTAQERAS